MKVASVSGTRPAQTGSLHWQNSDGSEGTYNINYYLPTGDFSQQFLVINNVMSGTYPFDLPFFFIFNVAVGGSWPGPPDNTTVFPQRMFVDYVRVFQQ